MDEAGANRLDRREFISVAAFVGMVLGVPAAVVELSRPRSDGTPSEDQSALLAEVCDLVIPRTGTLAASEVGVGAFVSLAMAHGLEGTRKPLPIDAPPALSRHRRRDGSLDHLAWLESELDRRSNGNFLAAPLETRTAALARLDSDAFAGTHKNDAAPWRDIKGLILAGYYTTEEGGSRELRYELVPGRWDPDLPAKPGDRAFSSDWAAVDFG